MVMVDTDKGTDESGATFMTYSKVINWFVTVAHEGRSFRHVETGCGKPSSPISIFVS
jgi:hypothetical protein